MLQYLQYLNQNLQLSSHNYFCNLIMSMTDDQSYEIKTKVVINLSLPLTYCSGYYSVGA